jgi:hypothetical protein
LADLCERLQITDPYRVITPNKKEFTFVPRTADAVNRSRIDFFLISTNLILNGIDCTIAPNLQNKLFDHWACFLTLKKPICERRPNKPVDNKILEHDITDYVIFAAAAEAYAVHASNEDLAVNDQRAALRSIGQLKKLIREIGPPVVSPDALLIDNGLAHREERDALIRRADLFKDEINRLGLMNLRVVPDPDVFLETLLGMIKNDLISYQVYARYLENKSFKDLKQRIEDCKQNGTHLATLFDLEKELDKMSDAMMRGEVSKHPMFDLLNNEKITPHFVSMVKLSKKTESLLVIKDDNGEPFVNETGRNSYITDYYRNLYTRDINAPALNANSIEEFLGPEICESGVVQNSKLTLAEQNLIDGNFSVDELDAAAKEAKSSTAGGPDGIGNVCIKKYGLTYSCL